MSPRPDRRRRVGQLAAAGVAVDVAVVLVDLLTPGWNVPITALLIAPLLPAAAGGVRATASLAALTVLVAAGIGASHGRAGEFGEVIRLISVALVGGLALVSTRLRGRVDELLQALDALPDAVTIQGPEGEVLYGNRAARTLGGSDGKLSRAAAEDYLARMVVTGEDGTPLDPSRMPAQSLMAGRDAQPVLVRSLDPQTGSVTWSRVKASPLEDGEGRVRSAVNVIEDVTVVKRAEQRAAFIADVGAVLGASLDIDVTLQRTARLVIPQLADWCAVDLIRPRHGSELVALAHRVPEKAELVRELRRRTPAGVLDGGLRAVLETGKPRLVPLVTPDDLRAAARDPEHLELLERLGLTSLLVVPLTIGTRVIGALTWATSDARRRYDPDDMTTALELAGRAAVAVENARVHTARVEISTVLQAALLPSALPELPGWEPAAHYRAAGAANDVGGDFYDVVVLEDGTVVALVGDVAGKGARAAALTARSRHTLVTAATLAGGDPSEGLALLNGALRDGESLELCSVAVLVLRGDELTVLSAGHPLPLLRRDGTLREVGETSPMLGAAPPGHAWRATTERILAGDELLLHTDGITDAVGEEERFGEPRLHAAFLGAPLGAQAAVDHVVAAVDAFERGPQADDRALLVLRRE